MILSFARKTPWGELTDFRRKVAELEKIHTFRMGNRWRPGMKIHFWDSSPRSKGSAKLAPEEFFLEESGVSICKEVRYSRPDEYGVKRVLVKSVQDFEMQFNFDVEAEHWQMFLRIDGKLIGEPDYEKGLSEVREVCENDGLSIDWFVRWFVHSAIKKETSILTGQVVHWTNFRYE